MFKILADRFRSGKRKRGPRPARVCLGLESLEDRRLLSFAASMVAFGDFNSDGHQDMVLALPTRQIGDYKAAGAVHVVYGTADGADQGRQEFWYQGAYDPKSNDYILGSPKPAAHFGHFIAVGDFNGDGYDDLAIATDDIVNGTLYVAGQVHIIYGSSNGLQAKVATPSRGTLYNQVLLLEDLLSGRGRESHDPRHSPHQMATGDFNDDGYADLAIGWSGVGVPKGVVSVIYGGTNGLQAANGPGAMLLSAKNVVDLPETPAYNNTSQFPFGTALAAGDFDGDGADDLAIGVPKPNGPGAAWYYSSYVAVVYGKKDVGLMTLPDSIPSSWLTGYIPGQPQILQAGKNGIQENWQNLKANTHYGFGYSLAAGDFNGDGYADLAIGAPLVQWALKQTCNPEGVVHVVYGGASRLDAANGPGAQRFWSPQWAGGHSHDNYGRVLAAGDFDGNGADDLAIGNPYWGSDAGSVHVIYGTPIKEVGLREQGFNLFGYQLAPPRQVWWKMNGPYADNDPLGVLGSVYTNDRFGWSLAVGDVDGNGRADLAVLELRDLDMNGDVAMDNKVHVIYSSSSGLARFPTDAPNSQLWYVDGTELKKTTVNNLAVAHGSLGSKVIADHFTGQAYAVPTSKALLVPAVDQVFTAWAKSTFMVPQAASPGTKAAGVSATTLAGMGTRAPCSKKAKPSAEALTIADSYLPPEPYASVVAPAKAVASKVAAKPATKRAK